MQSNAIEAPLALKRYVAGCKIKRASPFLTTPQTLSSVVGF